MLLSKKWIDLLGLSYWLSYFDTNLAKQRINTKRKIKMNEIIVNVKIMIR